MVVMTIQGGADSARKEGSDMYTIIYWEGS